MEDQGHGQQQVSLRPQRPHSARLIDVPSVFGQVQLLAQEEPVVPPSISRVLLFF